METIVQFLKSQLDFFSEEVEKITSIEKGIEALNDLFSNSSKTVNHLKHLKVQPMVQKYQIWTVKNEYDDFQVSLQKTPHPFIVLIISDLNDIEEELFVRVKVISPFIEMATKSDTICDDTSIIGFPFLVETWNDQPILVEILDEYIGYYELSSELILMQNIKEMVSGTSTEYLKDENLTDIQRNFRDIEISRAKYLNHSVLSLLVFLENQQSYDAGVVISLFDRIEYPKLFMGEIQKESIFSLAAKAGIDTEDKYLLLDNDSLPFKMLLRKNEEGFIIAIDFSEKMELRKKTNDEVVSGISNKDKTVFANLKSGIYTLMVESINKPIKIRLK